MCYGALSHRHSVQGGSELLSIQIMASRQLQDAISTNFLQCHILRWIKLQRDNCQRDGVSRRGRFPAQRGAGRLDRSKRYQTIETISALRQNLNADYAF